MLMYNSQYSASALEVADKWACAHIAVIRVAYRDFITHGGWTTPKILQRRLDQADEDVDIMGAAQSTPVVLGPPWRGPDGNLFFRIRALVHLTEAQHVLECAVELLQLAYSRYKAQSEQPRLTRGDLVSEDHVVAARILSTEEFGVIAGSDRIDSDWAADVNQAIIREVRAVSTIRDYLEISAQYFQRNLPTPPTVFQPSGEPTQATPEETVNPVTPRDPRKVFVVHGRNAALRDAMFQFLRAVDLHPIEWSEAERLTNKPTPYVGDVLNTAFAEAQAVVVLLSPDDVAYLRKDFHDADDDGDDRHPTGAARPNVLFEAGIAMGRHEDRTVIVRCGRVRRWSDVGGRHVLKLTNDTRVRQRFIDRLRSAQLLVKVEGTDWHTAGDFEPANLEPEAGSGSGDGLDPAGTSPVQLDASFQHRPDHGGSLVVSNMSDTPAFDVSVKLPDDLIGVHVLTHELPLKQLPPRKSISLPVALTMPRNYSSFNVTITAKTGDDQPLLFESFISVL